MAVVQPSPAATVVLVRDSAKGIEVLMLLRNSRLAFNGGHWVFPGGKIDTRDYQTGSEQLEYPAARNAAVRETREETGIIIDHKDLIHTAHWTTPEHLPRRFSTWFFLCPLYKKVKVNVDQGEILDYRWISPADALTAPQDGHFKVPRPTRVTLKDLLVYSHVDELLSGIRKLDIRVFPAGSEFYRPLEMGFDSNADLS